MNELLPLVALAVAAASACAAAVALLPSTPRALRRRKALRAPRHPAAADTRRANPGSERKTLVAVAAAGAALLPLAQGLDLAHLLAGIVACACAARWLRRARVDRPPATPELDEYALLVDLLAACLCAGVPLPTALRAVAAGSDGLVAQAFAEAAARWMLGADTDEVAGGLVGASPVLRPLAAVLAQAESGAALAGAIQRLAADARRERRWRLLSAARSVGTRSALPLTLCFLPAFLLVSVVPLLVATATRLLA